MAQAVGQASDQQIASSPRRGRNRAVMSHSYSNILIHALFSTNDRQPSLVTEFRDETFRYLGGAINALGGQSLLVNGPRDHVHMLFVQPRTLSIADVMEKFKASSSGWSLPLRSRRPRA